jgi:hypothetical protein
MYSIDENTDNTVIATLVKQTKFLVSKFYTSPLKLSNFSLQTKLLCKSTASQLFKSIHCILSKFSFSNVILSAQFMNFAVSSNHLTRVNLEEAAQ